MKMSYFKTAIIGAILATAVGGCIGRYHLVFDKGEPKVVDEESGIECERYASSFDRDSTMDFYGPPCNVILKRSKIPQ